MSCTVLQQTLNIVSVCDENLRERQWPLFKFLFENEVCRVNNKNATKMLPYMSQNLYVWYVSFTVRKKFHCKILD